VHHGPGRHHRNAPQRRAVLAAGLLAAIGLPCRAQTPRQARPTVLSRILPDAPAAEVAFAVAGESENRLVFAAMRCTVPIQAASLVDPMGRVVWRRSLLELGFRGRETMSRPELGDGYVLPEVRDAASGRWQLRIERDLPTGGGGRLQLAYSVFPRFELDIVPAQMRGAAGQPLLFSVQPRDYGVPLAGLESVEVEVLDAQGRRVARVSASEHEPGTYHAQLGLRAAGRYRLQVTHRLGPTNASTRTAVAELTVDGQAGVLRLAAVRPDPGQGGCAKGLLLDFDVQAAVAGTYTCNLTLRGGNPALPRAGATADLVAGPGASHGCRERSQAGGHRHALAAVGPGGAAEGRGGGFPHRRRTRRRRPHRVRYQPRAHLSLKRASSGQAAVRAKTDPPRYPATASNQIACERRQPFSAMKRQYLHNSNFTSRG